MAVLMNKQLGNIVEGGYRATQEVFPGQFVVLDYVNREASIASTPTEDDVRLVLQRNDTIDQEAVADGDVVYKEGEFLPTRKLQLGDVFTTDKFTGTYDSITVGSDFVVSGGVVAAGTPEEGLAFKLKEKTTLFGNPALKLEVVSV